MQSGRMSHLMQVTRISVFHSSFCNRVYTGYALRFHDFHGESWRYLVEFEEAEDAWSTYRTRSSIRLDVASPFKPKGLGFGKHNEN